MPIIVPCPNCQGQLRVADDLIGRKVRCPACSTTFDAEPQAPTPPAPPPPPPAPRREPPPPRSAPLTRSEPVPARPSAPMDPNVPVPTEKLDPWKHLNLELTAEKKEEPREKPLPPMRGAVELEQDAPRKESPADPDAPPRPRLNDGHDDLQPCPSCGRMVHRDARRCFDCQMPLPGNNAADERRGPGPTARRDQEPHRGGLILTLGLVSLAGLCMPLSIVLIVPAIMAWSMGTTDLRKMRRGTMDAEGESSTQSGWICGIIGTILNGLMILLFAGCMGLMVIGSIEESRNRQRPAFQPPPARRAR